MTGSVAWHPSRLQIPISGPLIVALVGAGLFVVVQPAVPDLQAAEARAAAASHGVGAGYWLSWFGGSLPGDYSMLVPLLSALVGAVVVGALATVMIALTARPVLAGTARARSGAYLMVGLALFNLWSGRVPFGLGAAFALSAVLALRRQHSLLGGVLNVAAAFCSPLAAAFVLLGILGPAITGSIRRSDVLRFAIPSLIGLAIPAAAFGLPGPMPFDVFTLLWTLLALIAAGSLWRFLPTYSRFGVGLALVATLVIYFLPTGVGSNMQRYACFVLPVLTWTTARSRGKITALAVIPAVALGGSTTLTDVIAAQSPAAQGKYYTALREELLSQPQSANFRVEVIDTPTHRAARELAPNLYLARGWEVQADAADNPIFYQPRALTPTAYQKWLDDLAVAWVAVPNQPDSQYEAEAALVGGGQPYLHEVWHDRNWRLYSVDNPTSIVSGPARIVTAAQDSLIIDIPTPTSLTLRIRPSRYLRLTKVGASNQSCLDWTTPTAAHTYVTTPGRYKLGTDFTVSSLVGAHRC